MRFLEIANEKPGSCFRSGGLSRSLDCAGDAGRRIFDLALSFKEPIPERLLVLQELSCLLPRLRRKQGGHRPAPWPGDSISVLPSGGGLYSALRGILSAEPDPMENTRPVWVGTSLQQPVAVGSPGFAAGKLCGAKFAVVSIFNTYLKGRCKKQRPFIIFLPFRLSVAAALFS